MWKLIQLLVFTVSFAGFAVACSGQTTVKDTFDDLGRPLFVHPNQTHIEFTESVSERDRHLITMAIDMAQPLFEDAGFQLGVKLYVVGDEDSYLKISQTLFHKSPEEARKKPTRGSTNGYNARVLINIPLHDDLYEGDKRDVSLVFTVVHELYHVLQTRLAEGWNNVTEEPLWLRESSANLGAYRAMLNALCVPLAEINTAVSSFSERPKCSKEFVEENISNYTMLVFFADQTVLSAIELYLVAEFGIDVYDRLYAALPETAATFTGDVAAAREQLWLQALERTVDAPSLDIIEDRAIVYIEEHEQELLQRLNNYEAGLP